jgi:hypothetical protein
MIQLEPTSAAPWARASLAEVALELRGRAAATRKRVERLPSTREAGNYIAEAYEEAAILLEKRLAGINPNTERV